MLEFIVLGLIPGTSVQITFAEILLLTMAVLIAGELKLLSHRHDLRKTAQELIHRIAL